MLEQILNKHKADKSRKHKYHEIYEQVFAPVKDDQINILEVGVLKGESLCAWLEYFPNATIYCIDTFERHPEDSVDVLKDERIHWLKGDSTLKSIKSKMRSQWGAGKDLFFDFIIDDGLHTPEANAKTLNNLFPYLKEKGTYFVEDVWPLHIMTDAEWKHPWVVQRPKAYTLKKYELFQKSLEGKGVTQIDLRRRTKEPDSYIIQVWNTEITTE